MRIWRDTPVAAVWGKALQCDSQQAVIWQGSRGQEGKLGQPRGVGGHGTDAQGRTKQKEDRERGQEGKAMERIPTPSARARQPGHSQGEQGLFSLPSCARSDVLGGFMDQTCYPRQALSSLRTLAQHLYWTLLRTQASSLLARHSGEECF